MIRAAILGLGRWGRSLVNSVQGKSRRYRVRRRPYAHPRDRGSVLPRQGRAVRRLIRANPRRPQHRCGRAGDAAQPPRRADRAGGGRRQARVRREADDARSRERASGGRGRRQGRRDAGGRLQPPLPSLDRRDPQPQAGRPPRRDHRDGRAAHHQHAVVPRARQLALRSRGGAGRRHDGRRRAPDGSHDRARRPHPRGALRDRRARPRPGRGHHHGAVHLRGRRHRDDLLLGRDRHQLQLLGLRLEGDGGDFRRRRCRTSASSRPPTARPTGR